VGSGHTTMWATSHLSMACELAQPTTGCGRLVCGSLQWAGMGEIYNQQDPRDGPLQLLIHCK